MEIKIIDNQERWDGWLAQNMARPPFTQSWAWGEILIAEGKVVERLAVAESGAVLAQAQIVYSQLPFGWQYAFCPKGPSAISNFQFPISKIYELLSNYLKAKKCTFFRFEPEIRLQTSDLRLQKTIDINTAATLILDLKKSEEELLAGMQQKTRYNIHLAEKKELKIKNTPPFIPPLKGEGQGVGLNLEVFWELMTKTGSRDKFSLHHKSHYEAVLKSPMVYQLTACESDKAVACAVFANFAGTFTYLYGASDYEYRNLMAPYLLQWQGIKMGKSLGCQWYDFFGMAPVIPSFPRRGRGGLPETALGSQSSATPLMSPLGKGGMIDTHIKDDYVYDPHHQYAGVTRFKLGFGGTPFLAPGTFDVVIDSLKYKMYNFMRKLRRLI